MQLKLENELFQQQFACLVATLNTYEDIFKSRKEIWDDAIYNQKDRKKLGELFDKIR